jgi:hypothetical protein
MEYWLEESGVTHVLDCDQVFTGQSTAAVATSIAEIFFMFASSWRKRTGARRNWRKPL